VRKTAYLILKIGVPLAFVVGLIAFLRADFMQIAGFEVEGEETISEKSIKDTAVGLAAGTEFFFIPNSNLILFDRQELANALLSKFGRIQSTEVKKNLLSREVKISVQERKSDFLWCSEADECFFMDRSGLIFEQALDTGGLIVFKGALKGDPIRKNFASAEKMRSYSKLIETLESADIKVASISLESEDKAVVQTSVGGILLYPGEADFSAPAQNAILLVQEIRSKDPGALFSYIDARFGNKIFYKLSR
jgi:hypothetical protein